MDKQNTQQTTMGFSIAQAMPPSGSAADLLPLSGRGSAPGTSQPVLPKPAIFNQPVTLPDKQPPPPFPTFQFAAPGPFNRNTDIFDRVSAPLPGGGNATFRVGPAFGHERQPAAPFGDTGTGDQPPGGLRPFRFDASMPLFKATGRDVQFGLNATARFGGSDTQLFRGGVEGTLKLGGEQSSLTLTGGVKQQQPVQSLFGPPGDARTLTELQGTLKLGDFSAGVNFVGETGAGRPQTQRFDFPLGLTLGRTRLNLTPSFTRTEGVEANTNQSLTLQVAPSAANNDRPSFSFGAQVGNNPSLRDSSYFQLGADYRF